MKGQFIEEAKQVVGASNNTEFVVLVVAIISLIVSVIAIFVAIGIGRSQKLFPCITCSG